MTIYEMRILYPGFREKERQLAFENRDMTRIDNHGESDTNERTGRELPTQPRPDPGYSDRSKTDG